MLNALNVQMLDITEPKAVQVEFDSRRRVLYVHVDGITVLRICRISKANHKYPIFQVVGEEKKEKV